MWLFRQFLHQKKQEIEGGGEQKQAKRRGEHIEQALDHTFPAETRRCWVNVGNCRFIVAGGFHSHSLPKTQSENSKYHPNQKTVEPTLIEF